MIRGVKSNPTPFEPKNSVGVKEPTNEMQSSKRKSITHCFDLKF